MNPDVVVPADPSQFIALSGCLGPPVGRTIGAFLLTFDADVVRAVSVAVGVAGEDGVPVFGDPAAVTAFWRLRAGEGGYF